MELADLAVACLTAMNTDAPAPGVVLSIPRGWKAPKGFPRRELLSDAGPHQHPVYRIDATRLMAYLVAQGVVELKVDLEKGEERER